MDITAPTSSDEVKEVTKALKIIKLQVQTVCRQRVVNMVGMR
jgi:hypothetical protein